MRTTWRYIPEDVKFHNYRCENPNSYKILTSWTQSRLLVTARCLMPLLSLQGEETPATATRLGWRLDGLQGRAKLFSSTLAYNTLVRTFRASQFDVKERNCSGLQGILFHNEQNTEQRARASWLDWCITLYKFREAFPHSLQFDHSNTLRRQQIGPTYTGRKSGRTAREAQNLETPAHRSTHQISCVNVVY
jgi:hypothetical protein